MFLRFHARIKDGKDRRYWSVVENRRCGRGKVVQRQLLYLGEINDSQHESWVPARRGWAVVDPLPRGRLVLWLKPFKINARFGNGAKLVGSGHTL